jgi:hypothetical protein
VKDLTRARDPQRLPYGLTVKQAKFLDPTYAALRSASILRNQLISGFELAHIWSITPPSLSLGCSGPSGPQATRFALRARLMGTTPCGPSRFARPHSLARIQKRLRLRSRKYWRDVGDEGET